MLVRLPKYEQQYVNALQLSGIFIRLEFMIAMTTIGIYNNETETWSFRRMFWYTMLGFPAIAILLSIASASIKYLLMG